MKVEPFQMHVRADELRRKVFMQKIGYFPGKTWKQIPPKLGYMKVETFTKMLS